MPKLGEGHLDDENKKGPVLHKVHPESRRARQLERKKKHRVERRNRKHNTVKRSHALMELCAWTRLRVMQDEEESGKERAAYTELEATQLYGEYIDKLVGEALAKSGGRPLNTTESIKAEEMKRLRDTWHKTGLRLPDITSARTLRNLKAWEGEPVHLGAEFINDHDAVEFKLFCPSK